VSTPAYDPIVPATGRLPLRRGYDRMITLTMRERLWRPGLVAALVRDAGPGGTVVDVGAGTGTLAIALAETGLDVTGVDGDRETLAIARAKPGGERVDWRDGRAEALPVPDAHADVVVTSLLLHHLRPPAKAAMLRESRRVLKPDGRLHVVDWGRPHDVVMRAAFGALQLVDGVANTRDHAAGRLPQIVAAAGFADVTTHRRVRTVFGTLEWLGGRPASR
jgi:ubiquinone/menaquinone biosynthesis C-methylase UbiE